MQKYKQNSSYTVKSTELPVMLCRSLASSRFGHCCLGYWIIIVIVTFDDNEK